MAKDDAERLIDIEKDEILQKKFERLFLGSDDGKDVLAAILDYCDMYEDPFTGNSKTYHILGRQDAARFIMRILDRNSFLGHLQAQREGLLPTDYNIVEEEHEIE